MAYWDAHKAAMDWLSNQWFSQWQISDAINKVRQQRDSGMSRNDIMNDVRRNTWDYFWGRPMYNQNNTMNWYLNELGDSGDYDYDWGGWEERVLSWEERNPATIQKLNWEDYSFQSHEDGSITVSTWKLNKTFKKWDKLYDIANNFMNNKTSKQTSTNPNAVNTESGLWDQAVSARDSKAYENYDNAYQYYKSQWLSNEDAAKRAEYWLDNNTISKSKKDKEAEASTSATTDDDNIDNNTLIVDQVPTDEATEGTKYDKSEDPTNWEMDNTQNTNTTNTDTSNWENTWNNMSDDEKSEVIQIALQQMWFTPSTQSNVVEDNVVENKAKVSKDPIFDFNTYFDKNLSWPENVWKTGQVKNKIEQGPLTNVRSYDEETNTALQNLWFLQPDTEAANNMPDTVEQEDVKSFENPEQLMTDFDSKLTEMQNTNWIAPQAVAQAYVDYRNQLAKYIRENNIPDDEAAAMFDQLKKNEKLNELLNQSKK